MGKGKRCVTAEDRWKRILSKTNYYNIKDKWEKALKANDCRDLKKKEDPLAGIYKTHGDTSTLGRISNYNSLFWGCFSNPVYTKQKIDDEIKYDVTEKGILQNGSRASQINERLKKLHEGPVRSAFDKVKAPHYEKYGRYCHSKDESIFDFLKIARMKEYSFLIYPASGSQAEQESKSKAPKFGIASVNIMSKLQRNVGFLRSKGKSIKEIATELNCTEQNIRKALSRYVKNCRKQAEYRDKIAQKKFEKRLENSPKTVV